MKLNFINESSLKRKEKRKMTKKGFKKTITLSLTAIMLIAALTGCNPDKTKDADITSDMLVESQEETSEKTQEEIIQDLMSRIEQLEKNQNGGITIGDEDTYLEEDWNKFVTEAKKVISGKINNTNDKNFEIALSLWNINFLSDNGKQVLLDLYDDGRDVESILNTEYSLASQIREYNTEISKSDDYFKLSNLALSDDDKAIIATLDEYYLEIYTLRQDLTKGNKARIQEIFDMILAFSNGTGKIKVSVGGEIKDIAQIHLTDGGIFAAEIVAQQISVMTKDIVSQKSREELDGQLRNKDNLANVQELIIKYTTLATIDGINLEEQAKIVSNYEQGLVIIEAELEAMGVTKEEAKSLYIVNNIDYFMNSLESQNAFSVIYEDGFNINETFTLAEEAVSKIVIYNDKQTSVDKIYDMARLSMISVEDAISLRALSQNAYNVTSSDTAVQQSAANIIKGYSQFSSDVKVEYQTRDENNVLVDHALDKNALTKGGHMVANWYTFSSLTNHKSIYDKYMDTNAIIKYVDGTAQGLDPYEAIIFMVEDYCAENNVAVYDYQMGK